MSDKYYKVYQDFTPVVLTKKKTSTSLSSQKSKSNIHIHNPIDDDEIKPIVYYPIDKINIIKQAREAAGLTQKELSKKISSVISPDFISKIEGGKLQYDNQTYKKILRVLNINDKN